MGTIEDDPIADRLVQAALSLLQRDASDEPDLARAARNAEVDEADALRLFPGRGDLWLAIVNALRSRLMRLYGQLSTERDDALEALAELHQIHVRQLLRQPATQKLLKALVGSDDPRLRGRVQQFQAAYLSDVAALVSRARERDLIPPDIADETVASMFLILIQGSAFRIMAGAEPGRVAEEAQAQFAHYLKTLRRCRRCFTNSGREEPDSGLAEA